MTLNKHDRMSDSIADLYRSALYMARKSKDTGISFLLKSKFKLGKKLSLDVDKIKRASLDNHFDSTYWAEKILDEYKRLK